MNRKKSMMTWCAVIVIVCFVISTACYAQEPIMIGVSSPTSGEYAEYGKSMQAGVELAVAQLNKAGGIQGRPFELVMSDSQGDSDIARRIARKFVSNATIVAEIGDFTSSCSMAAQPIYERGGMAQLSPTASHPSFAPGSSYSFGIVGIQAGSPFMAKVATELLGKQRIAIATLQTDWGIAMKEAFLQEAMRLGAEIVAQESYFEGTTDFSELLTKLLAAKPQVIFLASMVADAAGICKQLQLDGQADIILMGSQSLNSPELIQLGGSAVEGLIVPTLFFSKAPRQEVQNFVQSYETVYQSSPDWVAAISYDAMNLLAEAIKQGGTERQAIQKALLTIPEYSGVTGKIIFSQHGDVIRDYTLLQVQNEEFILLREE